MNTGWCMIFISDMEIVASGWAEGENALKFVSNGESPVESWCTFLLWMQKAAHNTGSVQNDKLQI